MFSCIFQTFKAFLLRPSHWIITLFVRLNMTSKSQTNRKAPRACQTRAQIKAHLIPSGLPLASKPTPAAVKCSRLAANARSASLVPMAGKSTKDSPTFDCIDYQSIITYLLKPAIQNTLFGGGSHTWVSGMPMGPKLVLTPLAIELNNDYNIHHNTKNMRLNGRVLHLCTKRYMSKYKAYQVLSLKTRRNCSNQCALVTRRWIPSSGTVVMSPHLAFLDHGGSKRWFWWQRWRGFAGHCGG